MEPQPNQPFTISAMFLSILNNIRYTNAKINGKQKKQNKYPHYNRRRTVKPTKNLIFSQLRRGAADGELTIINEAPRVTGGVRTVVDSIHTGRSAFKETGEAEVSDGKKAGKK